MLRHPGLFLVSIITMGWLFFSSSPSFSLLSLSNFMINEINIGFTSFSEKKKRLDVKSMTSQMSFMTRNLIHLVICEKYIRSQKI